MEAGTLAEGLRRLAKSTNCAAEALREALENARSMRDPYVDLLYWLLREKGAPDLPPPNRKGKAGLLTTSLHPERQHIVPISRLDNGQERRPTRQSTHVVNSLGNLTWISHKSNTFDGGWGNEIMTVDKDEDRGRHFLHGADAFSLAELQKVYGKGVEEQVPVGWLEEFSKHRAHLIADGFQKWVLDVDAAAKARKSVDDESPVGRKDSLLDALLETGIPAGLSRRLDALVRTAWGRTSSRAAGWNDSSKARLRWRTKRDPAVFQGDGWRFEIRRARQAKSLGDELKIGQRILQIPAKEDGSTHRFVPADLASDDQKRVADDALDDLGFGEGS